MWQSVTTWSEQKTLVSVLLLLSAATHFIGLGTPREVIFDEVHFGKFVTSYCCSRERFFDIHPPHAKLLIAGAVNLSGYDGTLPFENIGQPYGEYSPVPWRLVPALMGTMLPAIIYGLLRHFGASRAAAFFGGLLIIFDNALTIQTRVISLDGVLLVGTFGGLLAYLAAEQRLRTGNSQGAFIWAAVAGALAGLAVGSKFTGLLGLGLIGILGLYRLVTSGTMKKARQWLAMGLVLLGAAAVVYLLGWVLHFTILTQPGSGDAWGIPEWNEPIVASFWRELIDLHRTMYDANNGLTTPHHDSSPWWGWPFMNNPVFYWQAGNVPPSLVGALYFIGNPVVWVGSTILLLAVLVWTLTMIGKEGAVAVLTKSSLFIPLLGYGLALYPLTRVDRGLFLYHYLTPLVFAIIIAVLWLDQRGWFKRTSLKQQPPRVYIAGALVLFFFILFSPLTYGFLLHTDLQQMLFWFSSWR